MALEKLITKVDADITGLENGLKTAEKKINSFGNNSTASLKQAAVNVGNAAMAAFKVFTIAAGVAGTALSIITKKSLENIDALAKQSDQLGISTEKLVAYNLAAEMGGSSAEGMTKALSTLTQQLKQTGSETGPLINTLNTLGLTSMQLQKMGLSDSFELLADKLARVEDPMTRLRMATELFGKEGRSLIPVLLEGSAGFAAAEEKARALGISISRIEAAQIEQANDAVSEMGMAFEGVGNTIAIKMAPALQFAANALTELIVRNDGFRSSIEKGVELGVRGFGYLLVAINRIEFAFRAIQLTWTSVYSWIIEGINKIDTVTKGLANGLRKVFGLEEIDTTAGLAAHAEDVKNSVQGIIDRMYELEETKPNVDGILEEFERIKAKSLETATTIANMRMGMTGEGDVGDDIDKTKEAQERQKAMEQEFSDSLTQIWQDGLIRKQIFNKKSWDVQAADVAGSLTKMTSSVASSSKSMFKINQMAAIANAIINTAQGVTKALSAYPPPISFAMAAAQAAAGFAQVNAIRSATFGGGGSSPTPGSGGSASASSAPSDLTNANQVGNTAANMQTQALRDVNISVQGFQITTDQLRDIMTGLNETIDDGGRIGRLNVIGGTR